MTEEKRIEDFGEKIEGAKKDRYTLNSKGVLYLENTPNGKAVKISKETLFPLKPSKKMIEEDGMDAYTAFWMRKVRTAVANVPVTPYSDLNSDATRDLLCKYRFMVDAFANFMRDIKTVKDVNTFYALLADDKFRAKFNVAYGFVITGEKILGMPRLKWAFEVARKNWPCGNADKEPKEKKKSKTRMVTPELKTIRRLGKDVLKGKDADAEMWQGTFASRGVQFGNWLNQNDRQWHLNRAYEALNDLADVLGIDTKDISFDGRLAFAFGARGAGGSTVAHYEPAEEVINLTKHHGAGSLAHEWFHALDDALGKTFVFHADHAKAELASDKGMYADNCNDPVVRTLNELIRSMKTRPDKTATDFLKHSKMADASHFMDDHGYWSSSCEMLARAFACYVSDKLYDEGKCSDYLCGSAEANFADGNPDWPVFPTGDERKRINEGFDKLFDLLKAKGFFTAR